VAPREAGAGPPSIGALPSGEAFELPSFEGAVAPSGLLVLDGASSETCPPSSPGDVEAASVSTGGAAAPEPAEQAVRATREARSHDAR